jgi:hypothetical protein
MAKNRTTGRGRQGAIRGRLQFRLPNGRYAKVDRRTGRILAVKADRKPWKGVVITPAPQRLLRREGPRPVLPGLVSRSAIRARTAPRRQDHARLAVVPQPVPLSMEEAQAA